MTERYYSSVATATELDGGIDGSTQSVSVDAVTGFPAQFPYTLALDFDRDDEELVDVTAAAGTNLTVTRGVAGTVGLSHESGAPVRHVITGRDLQDSRDHEEADSDVHGVGASSDVVGTLTVQTVEGKTLDGGDNTFQNIPQSAVTDLEGDQDDQDSAISSNASNISSLTTQVSNHEAATNTHGASTVAGVSEAQTLTNKTINGTSNTFQRIGAASLDRYILRKNAQGGSQGNVSPGTHARANNAYSITTNIATTGSWVVGGGAGSYQWVHPIVGLYVIFSQARWAPSSSPAGTDMRVYHYLRRDMDPGTAFADAETGTVTLSDVQTIRDTGFENQSQLNGIYEVSSTSSIHGVTLFNSSVSDSSLARDADGAGTYFQIHYLGPA